jgi:hypothetical protein
MARFMTRLRAIGRRVALGIDQAQGFSLHVPELVVFHRL